MNKTSGTIPIGTVRPVHIGSYVYVRKAVVMHKGNGCDTGDLIDSLPYYFTLPQNKSLTSHHMGQLMVVQKCLIGVEPTACISEVHIEVLSGAKIGLDK